MSRYIINKPLEMSAGFESRVFLPLAIITIFCFSFVLMQNPVKPTRPRTSTKTQDTSLASGPGASQLPVSTETPIETLSTISQPGSNQGSTSSPQSNNQMSQALQSANANNGNSSGKSSSKLEVIKQVNNLLNN